MKHAIRVHIEVEWFDDGGDGVPVLHQSNIPAIIDAVETALGEDSDDAGAAWAERCDEMEAQRAERGREE